MFLHSAVKLLLSAGLLLSSAVAHNIQLPAHGRECFHENLHRDDKMTVTFQVGDREFGGAGNLEIDFWVRMGLGSAHRNPDSPRSSIHPPCFEK